MPAQQRPEPPPKEPRGPFCAACGEAVDTEEEHYRSGSRVVSPEVLRKIREDAEEEAARLTLDRWKAEPETSVSDPRGMRLFGRG